MVILELIHATEAPTRVRARGRALLLDQDQPALWRLRASRRAMLVTLDNPRRSHCLLRRRRIFQMSALSTFDVRRHAKHGDDG